MRLHTDTIELHQVHQAAHVARADITISVHGSRKRDHAFDVKLTGESRRRPNGGSSNSEYAATWDQWGVFLAHLFAIDPRMTCWAYRDGRDFFTKTAARFGASAVSNNGEDLGFVALGWPEDAHGDHTFRYAGTPYEQRCTKCSAVQRWEVAA